MQLHDYPEQEALSENGKRYTPLYFKLSEGVTYEEEAYGDDPCQRLAIVRSPRPDGRVLLFMYGGGWTNGYKEMILFMAPHFVAEGVTFVSLGYRLAPRTVFPEGWLDSARGAAWVLRNIERYGGDPRKLFVGGWSAGGHHAALLATRQDWRSVYGVSDHAISGCITTSGVFDMTAGNGMSARPRFLGPIQNAAEVNASPVFHVDERSAPFLLTHGTDTLDFPHLVMQARKMEMVLKACGIQVNRLEFPDHDHFSLPTLAAAPDNPWTRAVLEWMAQLLDRPRTPASPIH